MAKVLLWITTVTKAIGGQNVLRNKELKSGILSFMALVLIII